MSLAQDAVFYCINNCVILGEHSGVHSGFKGSCLQQYLQFWWPETMAGSGSGWIQYFAHTQLWEPATCAYAVAGSSCRHPCSDRGKGKCLELWPTMGLLAAMEALDFGMLSWFCTVSPGCAHCRGGLDRGWAVGVQCTAGGVSYRGVWWCWPLTEAGLDRSSFIF